MTRLLLAILISLALASRSHAAETDCAPDKVTVKGTTLKGRVLSLDAEGIRFETIYGQGEILIRYEDIEKIQTQSEFYIYYSDGAQIRGRLIGKEGENLLVKDKTKTAFRLHPRIILRGIPEVTHEGSWVARLRAQYPWWKASLDAGWAFESSSVDQTKISLGFNAERRKSPTRLASDLRYAFESHSGRPRRRKRLPRTNCADSCWENTT